MRRKTALENRLTPILICFLFIILGYRAANAARDADSYINDAGRGIKRLIELKAKNVDPSDLYRMDAFGAEVKAFAAKAGSGSRTACIALKKAIGLPESEQFWIKETELPKNPVELESEEEYTQRALANRPELLEVKKGVEAKGKLADAAKSDLYPFFFAAAIGSIAGAPDRQKFDNSYIPDEFNHAYAGFFAGAHRHWDFGNAKNQGEYLQSLYSYHVSLARLDYAIGKASDMF